jgi:hypothetical protein
MQHHLYGLLWCILKAVSTKLFAETTEARQHWRPPMRGMRSNTKADIIILNEGLWLYQNICDVYLWF